MLKKRSIKTSRTKLPTRYSSKEMKFLLCKECNNIGVDVTMDVSAVTCAYCVQRQTMPEIKSLESKEKFPRGWALRATYIHTDGRIFEKGKDTGRIYTPVDPTSTIEFIPLAKKKIPKQGAKVVKIKKAKRRK